MPYRWSDDYGARLGVLPRDGFLTALRKRCFAPTVDLVRFVLPTHEGSIGDFHGLAKTTT